MCPLQCGCFKFSRIKIQVGPGPLLRVKALFVCCSSREPSQGRGVKVLPRGIISAALSFCHLLPKVCAHSHMHICTNTCVRSSNKSMHIYPYPPQTLLLTYVCMYFKCIPLSTGMYLLKHMDASTLNTSTQIHTHAHLTNTYNYMYIPLKRPTICVHAHTHTHTLRYMHMCVLIHQSYALYTPHEHMQIYVCAALKRPKHTHNHL